MDVIPTRAEVERMIRAHGGVDRAPLPEVRYQAFTVYRPGRFGPDDTLAVAIGHGEQLDLLRASVPISGRVLHDVPVIVGRVRGHVRRDVVARVPRRTPWRYALAFSSFTRCDGCTSTSGQRSR
jgi:hypothetical protein